MKSVEFGGMEIKSDGDNSIAEELLAKKEKSEKLGELNGEIRDLENYLEELQEQRDKSVKKEEKEEIYEEEQEIKSRIQELKKQIRDILDFEEVANQKQSVETDAVEMKGQTVLENLFPKKRGTGRETPETVRPKPEEETAEEKLKILVANLEGIAGVYKKLLARRSGEDKGARTELDITREATIHIESVMENRGADEIRDVIDNSDMGEEEKDYAKKAIEEYGIKPEVSGENVSETELKEKVIKMESLLKILKNKDFGSLESDELEDVKNEIRNCFNSVKVPEIENEELRETVSEKLNKLQDYFSEIKRELGEREINSDGSGKDEDEKIVERENAIDKLLNSDPQKISLEDIKDCIEKLKKTIKMIDGIKNNLREGKELREDLEKTLEWANDRLAKAKEIRSGMVGEQPLEEVEEETLVIKSQEEIERMKIEELNEEIEKVRDYLDGSFDYARKHQEATNKGVIIVEGAAGEEEERGREQTKKEFAECTNYLKALENAKKIQEKLETPEPKVERRRISRSLRESLEGIEDTIADLTAEFNEEGKKLRGLSKEEREEVTEEIERISRRIALLSLGREATRTSIAIEGSLSPEEERRESTSIAEAHKREIGIYREISISLNKAEVSFDKKVETKTPGIRATIKNFAKASGSKMIGVVNKVLKISGDRGLKKEKKAAEELEKGERIDKWINESGLKKEVGEIRDAESLKKVFDSIREGLGKRSGEMPEKIKSIFNKIINYDKDEDGDEEENFGLHWYIYTLGKKAEGDDSDKSNFEKYLSNDRKMIAILDEQNAFRKFMTELLDKIEDLGEKKFGEMKTGDLDVDPVASEDGNEGGKEWESMNMYALPGHKIVINQETADTMSEEKREEMKRRGIEIGKEYTVEKTEVFDWSSDLYLKEIPGKRFNLGCFEDVKKQDPELDKQHPNWARYNDETEDAEVEGETPTSEIINENEEEKMIKEFVEKIKGKDKDLFQAVCNAVNGLKVKGDESLDTFIERMDNSSFVKIFFKGNQEEVSEIQNLKAKDVFDVIKECKK